MVVPRRVPVEGRVGYTWPGKHGEKDLRADIDGIAPTHAELCALIWGLFWAEDRYSEPWQQGRAMLMGLIQELYEAQRLDDARPVFERARRSVEDRRAA